MYRYDQYQLINLKKRENRYKTKLKELTIKLTKLRH